MSFRQTPADQLWHAFDEAHFGPSRTLNLRESLPTGAEARARAESWLRERQVAGVGEVLVITGRGNRSVDGVPVVRTAMLALFPSLRRRNVVLGWSEHSPGSFVVLLAPLSALFEAPRRRREPDAPSTDPPSLAALEPATRKLLRQLAVESLDALGVRLSERFVESEMIAKFAALSAALPAPASDAALRAAIVHALAEVK